MEKLPWRARAMGVLRWLLEERGLSQSAVARGIGSRQSTTSSWLRGKRQMKRENAEALCKFAQVPVRYLDGSSSDLRPYVGRTAAPEPAHLALVRWVIGDEDIGEDDAQRLLAMPWEAIHAATGCEIDARFIRGQWLEILASRGRSEKIQSGVQRQA